MASAYCTTTPVPNLVSPRIKSMRSSRREALANPSHSSNLAPSDAHVFKSQVCLAEKTVADSGDAQDGVMTWPRGQAGDFHEAGIKDQRKTRSQAH